MAFALSNLVRKVMLRARRRDLSAMLSSFVFWLTMLLGTLVVLTIVLPSMKPADIFASLGIGSIALGFAFKDILQNWLAGFLILVRRPFRRGDQSKLGDIEGTVQAVETRHPGADLRRPAGGYP
jgi:small-conductance mechanosensitive channel